jgi:hypothetical protein
VTAPAAAQPTAPPAITGTTARYRPLGAGKTNDPSIGAGRTNDPNIGAGPFGEGQPGSGAGGTSSMDGGYHPPP